MPGAAPNQVVQFEFEEVSPVEKRLKVEVAKEQVNAKLEEKALTPDTMQSLRQRKIYLVHRPESARDELKRLQSEKFRGVREPSH